MKNEPTFFPVLKPKYLFITSSKFEVKDVEDNAQYKVERNIYLFTFVKRFKKQYTTDSFTLHAIIRYKISINKCE